MQLDKKINSVTLGGYISSVDTRIGQHGPFGSVTIAIDDGYRDVNNGNAWVDRTQFIRCEVSGKSLPVFTVGDYLHVEGKLTFEQWNDQSGTKSALKFKVTQVVNHLPKAALEVLKQANLHAKQLMVPKQAPGSGQGQPQRPAQQSAAYNQGRPQQSGFNQAPPPQGGYNPDFNDDVYPHADAGWHSQPVPQGHQQNRASRNPPPQR